MDSIIEKINLNHEWVIDSVIKYRERFNDYFVCKKCEVKVYTNGTYISIKYRGVKYYNEHLYRSENELAMDLHMILLDCNDVIIKQILE